MDLLTNAPVLSDAIKFVENCRDKLEAATPDISLKKVREDCITDKNEKNDKWWIYPLPSGTARYYPLRRSLLEKGQLKAFVFWREDSTLFVATIDCV